ncbi:hypothetical protein TBC1_12161 [Lentimicrobium saccharophilum]|uniref:DUF4199 domain-containing protein n=1 Tax=Lentimicrobium saccharophilum TaxID=1678841 RepID=A0A0S7BTU9_9BACT|nr:DUF4199 domain-containing protein [Lentimicrobium saccharophilum]GAP44357.1 hypothetical protein TBC1_12161 [Lentimicrobium saccharophilum]
MENFVENQADEPIAKAKISLVNHALRYGLYTAAAFVLFSLLLYSVDVSRTGWVNYLSFVILIIGIVIATIAYRDKINSGFLSYGRCLSIGVLISLVVGIVMAIYSYVFFTYFDPGALDKLLEASEQEMINRGMSDEEIDLAMPFTEKMMSPVFLSITSLLSMVLYGTVFSLITSIFIKKEDNSFEGAFRES